jgi:hypothetical protein
MALVPNKYTEQTLDEYDAPDEFSEAIGSVTVKCGWYESPAMREPILLEKTTIVRNAHGHENRRDEETWLYNRAGAPPMEYKRETYGRVYLPGRSGVTFGSSAVHLETVREEFHPWSLFQPGSANLSRRRTTEGWVVYDLRAVDKELTTEEKAELELRGRLAVGPGDVIVDSARPWSEAYKFGEIVRSADAPQRAIWRQPFESETELVFEEPDKFAVFSVRKNHLRDGPAEVRGPTYQRKEDFRYRLPVPILPPELEATEAAGEGIRLEVRGGGADVGDFVAPERYRIERRTVSEPARSTNADPWELYETPPAAGTKAIGIVETDATDYAGAASSSTPADTGHTEPGDTSEPDPEAWSVLAELDNAADPADEGYATTLDADVVNAAVYVYRAVAIIGDEESAPSSPARITYGGTTNSSAIRIRSRTPGDGSLEVDALAPADTELPIDYGELEVFDVPYLVDDLADGEELAEELARRQFAETRDAGLELELVTTEPLFVLERGQLVQTPAVEFSTTGNGLVLTSETEERAWRLDGFRLHFRRNEKSLDAGSTLYLVE